MYDTLHHFINFFENRVYDTKVYDTKISIPGIWRIAATVDKCSNWDAATSEPLGKSYQSIKKKFSTLLPPLS